MSSVAPTNDTAIKKKISHADFEIKQLDTVNFYNKAIKYWHFFTPTLLDIKVFCGPLCFYLYMCENKTAVQIKRLAKLKRYLR